MADMANGEFLPPVGELPASPAPAGPTQGEAPGEQDTNFILSTLFGDDSPSAQTEKPAGQQGQGSQPAGGQQSEPAPSTAAPAAQEPVATPQEKPPVPAAPATPAAPEQNQGGVGGPQTPAPGQAPAAAPQTPPNDGLTPELRLQLAAIPAQTQLIADLQRQLEEVRNGGRPQPQQGGQQSAPQPSGDQNDMVNLTVPSDLYNAVFSEDEATARQGLNVLVSAVATNAARAAIARVQPMIDNALQGYTQQSAAAQTAQQQEQSYYDKFPHHKDPLFRQVIASENEALGRSIPGAQWDDNYVNALGTRVQTRLQLLGFNVGPGQQPQSTAQTTTQEPKPPVAPAPAPMLDSTNRGGGGSGGAPEDFIAATFA